MERYYESQVFGLYNDIDTSEIEAKSIYQMYTDHRSHILAYNTQYADLIGMANSLYGLEGTEHEVEDFEDSISRAHDLLTYTYGYANTAFDEILVTADTLNKQNFNPKTQDSLIFGGDESNVIYTGSGFNVIYSGAGNDILISGPDESHLYGGADFDIYYLDSSSYDSYIIDDDGMVYANHTLITGNAKRRKNIGATSSNSWTTDQGYLLYQIDTDLIIQFSYQGNSPTAQIKDYPFASYAAPFGINLGGQFSGWGNEYAITLEQPIYGDNIYASPDPRGKFFAPKQLINSDGSDDAYIVTRYNSDGIVESNDIIAQLDHSSTVGQSFGNPSSGRKLDNGNIAFIYSILSTVMGNNNQIISRSSSAFLCLIDPYGSIISNIEVFQTNDINGIYPHFVTNKGMCFSAGQEFACGDLDSDILELTSDYEPYYEDQQWSQSITLPTQHKITLSDQAWLIITPPNYTQIPEADIIPNYSLESGTQITNPNYPQLIISAASDTENHLQVSKNPNSTLILMGYNNNPNANPYDLSEIKVYAIDASKYSVDNILDGGFAANSAPLTITGHNKTLSHLTLRERDQALAHNSDPDMVTQIWRDMLGDDEFSNDDDISLDNLSSEIDQQSTIIILPNNQTIMFIGVSATELAKIPEKYFNELTNTPSINPSSEPTSIPSGQPVSAPSNIPSGQPVSNPSNIPSEQPISNPSNIPSGQPISNPSNSPSSNPTKKTYIPSRQPVSNPSNIPSQISASPSYITPGQHHNSTTPLTIILPISAAVCAALCTVLYFAKKLIKTARIKPMEKEVLYDITPYPDDSNIRAKPQSRRFDGVSLADNQYARHTQIINVQPIGDEENPYIGKDLDTQRERTSYRDLITKKISYEHPCNEGEIIDRITLTDNPNAKQTQIIKVHARGGEEASYRFRDQVVRESTIYTGPIYDENYVAL